MQPEALPEEDAPLRPMDDTRPRRGLALAGVVVAVLAWVAQLWQVTAWQSRAGAPLGSLAYGTFVQLAWNWRHAGAWTQTLHHGYAEDWRWGGHYAGWWPLVAWFAGGFEAPWALARVQVALVGLGALGAAWLGWREARVAGALACSVLVLASAGVTIQALADYQDLVLVIPASLWLAAAARHAGWPGFVAAAVACALTREEALVLVPLVAAVGGARRALAGLGVSAAVAAAWTALGPPPYPNPLVDQVAFLWRDGLRALPGRIAVEGFSWVDPAFFLQWADASLPWLLLAPEAWVAALPTVVFHALAPTATGGVASPWVHHFAPLVAACTVGGVVGLARVLSRFPRAAPWIAAAALAWSGARAWAWKDTVARVAVRVPVAEEHPAWALLAGVPRADVLWVPDEIAALAATRPRVVTADSVGERIPAGDVAWAVARAGTVTGGEVRAARGGWVLVADPAQVPGRGSSAP
ncbi:MAG: hypothetical protein RLZZ299_1570 [Pseudomonadota bacterium]